MTQGQLPPADEPVWYYMMGQQKLGPVPTQTLLAMIRSGSIAGSTLVWRQTMSAWTPAGAVSEFSFAFREASSNPINEALTSKKEAALGLTTAGLILFIVLIFVCLPLCWLPWVIDSTRAR
jgi:hypothetical protein